MRGEACLFDVDQSLSGRFWSMVSADEAAIRTFSQKTGLPDLVARLLLSRGITHEEAGAFLEPKLRDTFPDPSSFQDMEKAAGLLLDAIAGGQSVVVFADYDVDGGTSSALLTRYFRHWGQELGLYVPDRLTEGYGPSPEAFRHLKEQGADLVVTVDCGAAATAALDEARAIGLPVIVVDHHLMGRDIPPTAALVNPNRADDTSGYGHLAAAGVVFVLLAAMNKLARERNIAPSGGLPDILQWLDLCALGTLCDMSPLQDANRAFVRQGLKIMARGQNQGLRALADIAGIGEIESVYHATFMLGPRLNAGGRIGDPWLAAKLLATEDRAEAIALAERLHGLNDERKAVETAILEDAQIQAERLLEADPDRSVLIASGEGWHPGVIGIVAGRLKDRFHLPSIVIGWGEGLGPVGKGSARSVKGVNIGHAITQAAKEGILISGGGHAMAGGLAIEPDRIGDLDSWMCAHMSAFKDERAEARRLEIDGVLAPGGISPELCDQIEALGPFGQGAPQPVFAIRHVQPASARRIGQNHVKFFADDGTARLECISWRTADTEIGQAVFSGQPLHIAGRLKQDEWNGRRRVQFEVIDAAIAR
ncbi:single-stranded-DNA-specific exonuclease RecJ [Henriciella aquimarina]|uniref:single-stranded-DNA-specific exonuclease RecJ n=1 Tax=Henriciella aquimarina TaxID=545261 RepID=UPI0009FE11A6|nr:single-stranded-DNA-specific exonuclease RecJ [Henriciella aquimarina]